MIRVVPYKEMPSNGKRIRILADLSQPLFEEYRDSDLTKTGLSDHKVGDIVIVKFPYAETGESKIRPAVIVEVFKNKEQHSDLVSLDEDIGLSCVVLLKITSKNIGCKYNEYDIENYKHNAINKLDVDSRISMSSAYVASDNIPYCYPKRSNAPGHLEDANMKAKILMNYIFASSFPDFDLIYDRATKADVDARNKAKESEKAREAQNNGVPLPECYSSEYRRRRRSLAYRRHSSH